MSLTELPKNNNNAAAESLADADATKAYNEMLDNSMLVSALILTVAAGGIMDPADQNISGSHTDLYGSLCVVSFVTCLGAMMVGTLVKTRFAEDKPESDGSGFASGRSAQIALLLVTFFMWAGAVAITVALEVNSLQVLGLRSLCVMVASTSVVALVCAMGICILGTVLKRVRRQYQPFVFVQGEDSGSLSLAASWVGNRKSELNNATLVSAVIFTVAANGILEPTPANIAGPHTDLYGCFCVLSLVSCLGAVLVATLVTTEIARVASGAVGQTKAVLENESVAYIMMTIPAFVYIGTIAGTGAIGVTIWQVVGESSFFLMVAVTAGFLLTYFLSFCLLSNAITSGRKSWSRENITIQETKANEAFCEARDSEINTSMLVAALIYTIAAAGILDPAEANILGAHTDLYSGLCVLSLFACLGAVMVGRLIKSQGILVDGQQLADYLKSDSVAWVFRLAHGFMWLGAIVITGAISVNVWQVLGVRSLITMIAMSAILFVLLGVSAYFLRTEVKGLHEDESSESRETFGQKGVEAAELYCDSKNNELNNAMLVSAVIFTTSTAGILKPTSANISGAHTDLYGGLCVTSMMSCLGSVMLGTLMQLNISKVQAKQSYQAHSGHMAFRFLEQRSVQCLMKIMVASMWIGAASVAGAICVDAYQVLGIRSLWTMIATTVTEFGLSFCFYMALRRRAEEHLGNAESLPPNPLRTSNSKNFCDAKDAELNNNTLVAALIFNVASMGVLDPTNANITGSHTDLYGALNIIALVSCLGCVLFGAVVKSQVANVVRSANEQSYAFCADFLRKSSELAWLTTAFLWVGTLAISGAIAVDVHQVLGFRSLCTMIGITVLVGLVCIFARCHLL